MTVSEKSATSIEVLRFIVAAWKRGGPMPTMRVICEAFGWKSTNAPGEYMAKLEASGAIRRSKRGGGYGIVLEHPSVKVVLEQLAEGKGAPS